MALVDEIKKNTPTCFKKVYIKRRLGEGSGNYEADWFEITDDVLKTSLVTRNIDNLQLNNFTQGDFSLTGLNDKFKFASELVSSSYFYGYLARHNTKVKIESGYIDDDDVEYATDLGSGLIDEKNTNIQSGGIAFLSCISPGVLFQDYNADAVNTGTVGSWYEDKTVAFMVDKIYNLTQNGVGVFTKILEGSSISPGNNVTADNYDFTDMTCDEALTELAEISNSAWWVDADFVLQFQPKTPTVASQFTLSGAGSNPADVNIYDASDYNRGLDNLRTRITWLGTEPLVKAEESWTPGDESSSNRFGIIPLNISNNFVTTTATQQAIVDALLLALKEVKEEITLKVKFLPQIKLLDRITVNYFGDVASSAASYYNYANWNQASGTFQAYWSTRRGGIRIKNQDMMVIKIEHDVENFKTTLVLRTI